MRTVSGILFLTLLLDPAIAQTAPGLDDFGTPINDTPVLDSTSVPDTTQPELLPQMNQSVQKSPDSINGNDTLVAPVPQTEALPVREDSITPAKDSDTLVTPIPQTEDLPVREDSITSAKDSDTLAAPAPQTKTPSVREALKTPARPIKFVDTLAGNLPRVIVAREGPYLVTADIYVPSGKTITIEPGAIILFKNFTEFHIEGRLLAEGTGNQPIIFSSELDQTYNPGATLKANPYDWNGIFVHEGGLGSSLKNCSVCYTVYGINSLTRYIRIEQVIFRNNGRTDLTIEGKQHQVGDKPYSYALTIHDAKKDGVPVAILMDPRAGKRNVMRYGGFSLVAGGLTMGVWSLVLLNHDQQNLDALSNKTVIDENSPVVSNARADWEKAHDDRNRDRWMAGASFLIALAGSTGVTWSFFF